MEYTGKITHISDIIYVWAKSTPKVTVVLTELEPKNPKYPGSIGIDFMNNNTAMLDNRSVWDVVTIYFDTRTSERQGKYYTNILGYQLDIVSLAPTTDSVVSVAESTRDDMPF